MYGFCKAFTGRDFSRQSSALPFLAEFFSRAWSRALEEEILFKIQEAFGDFCTGEVFLDILLSGWAKVRGGLWG